MRAVPWLWWLGGEQGFEAFGRKRQSSDDDKKEQEAPKSAIMALARAAHKSDGEQGSDHGLLRNVTTVLIRHWTALGSM